jgi:hypothetical protein
MEPESSLTNSQMPATCSYPQTDLPSPYPHILLPENPSLILSSQLRLGLPSDLFPPGVPTETLYVPLLSHIRSTYSVFQINL